MTHSFSWIFSIGLAGNFTCYIILVNVEQETWTRKRGPGNVDQETWTKKRGARPETGWKSPPGGSPIVPIYDVLSS